VIAMSSEKRERLSGGASTVVVGVDGSEHSIIALRWAVDYAKTVGARVRAVIAWRWPISMVVALPVVEVYEPEQEALKRLEAAVAEALGDGPASDVEVRAEAIYGAPVPVLLEAASHAALLVVGSRGHGGFHGLLLGSTGEHCVRHANCPVVVVRPEDVVAGAAADK
jgi:nucleotide-binding universal stress UspA family protein